ncbi:hypothetical protein IJ101_00860 [Candidatus Saccharibacteria bacterium]|nr:hypothetical protein [Candidatus Saccharibacteria bacterium]
MNKNKINNVFQASIFDNEPGQRPASGKNTPVEKAGKRKEITKEPATTLMKTVAEKAFVESKARKVFSQEEIDEILDKKTFGEDLTKQDRAILRIQYKKMKSWVKEKEAGNQSQVIAIPSLTDGTDEFYKVFDFSALYYVYRLADRMGRNATLRIDKDERPKMLYQASIKDIVKFAEQFQELENPTIEKTLEGIYIFTLKRPLSDEELGQLRAIEEERRERLNGIVKPKAMDPAVFQSLLTVVRQVAPKV